MRTTLLMLAVLACCGCTHRQLSRSVVHQASTVMTIEYQMVLDNIAMFSYNPGVLPSHIRINDGTVQVNDEGGMPELGVQWGGTPGFTRGIRAVRSVTEQWGAHPIVDPLVVKTLQDVYRQAVGLPPEPDPPLLAQLSMSAEQAQNADRQSSSNRSPDTATDDQTAEELSPPAGEVSARDKALEELDPSLPYAGSPLLRLRDQLQAPVGWFCVGCKQDVPGDACFVGHYCDRYVWVMPQHVNDLSHFTLLILGITKHGASSQPSRGLAYVRH
jgi:hypothetical protein